MLLFHYLVLSEFKHAGNKSDTELGKEIRVIRKKGAQSIEKIKK